MQFCLNAFEQLKSDVVRVWLGPKLLVGLTTAEDIEVCICELYIFSWPATRLAV